MPTDKSLELPPVGVEDCCGCGACAAQCPKNALKMTMKSGFMLPEWEPALCIRCGLCIQSCPVANPLPPRKTASEGCAAWNRDKEERRVSSSGGVFSVLARHILRQGGVVYGAAWAEDGFRVEHRRIESEKELPALRGSKYSQSTAYRCFADVKTQAKSGRPILFSGTACQVAALRRYLRRDYENLLCVDVLCHGVPSHKLLARYVEEYEAKGRQLKQLDMRHKKSSWLEYCMKRLDSEGRSDSIYHKADSYLRLFLSDNFLRLSCYHCAFSGEQRVSDITLGDFWAAAYGVANIPGALRNGVSSVLLNSEKARRLWTDLEGVESSPVSWQALTAGNDALSGRHRQAPATREAALQDLDAGLALDTLVRRYAFIGKKIGPFRIDAYRGPAQLFHALGLLRLRRFLLNSIRHLRS